MKNRTRDFNCKTLHSIMMVSDSDKSICHKHIDTNVESATDEKGD